MSDPSPSPMPPLETPQYAYWPQAPALSQAPGYALPPPPMLAGRPSNVYHGLTIASFVLSLLALLGVVVLLGIGLLSFSGGLGDEAGDMAPLTGTIPSTATLAPLSGDDLADTVADLIRKDGAGSVDMTCPATPQVLQNVTTVCHGQIDDGDWAVVVFFEDGNGSFTLMPV
ncbi:hypothetical protein [Terrabacter sp. MAHUQ-38]|uniref:hypothetical protein n=1 Tax=unclassified Terrabacter TaxID=2630222 RepID=UPI00165D908B|nr:hypothetical protein [Terrabacter sp. MAHUQ-38]MBC9820726.1 hypothetical protein [Terrabacter sp. MAHUQ-38]